MKPSTKRFISSMLALVLLVAAFVVFFEMVQPAYGDMMVLKGKLASEQTLLQNENTTITQVQKLITTYQGQVSAQNSLNAALPVGEDMAGAIAQVYGAASASGIIVTNIGISVSAPPTVALQENAIEQGSGNFTARPTGTIAFTVTAQGNYESFLNLLSALESDVRLFDVKQLSIQSAGAAPAGAGKNQVQQAVTQDLFTYILTVDTYYQVPQ